MARKVGGMARNPPALVMRPWYCKPCASIFHSNCPYTGKLCWKRILLIFRANACESWNCRLSMACQFSPALNQKQAEFFFPEEQPKRALPRSKLVMRISEPSKAISSLSKKQISQGTLKPLTSSSQKSNFLALRLPRRSNRNPFSAQTFDAPPVAILATNKMVRLGFVEFQLCGIPFQCRLRKA